jgi:hypothetical protein
MFGRTMAVVLEEAECGLHPLIHTFPTRNLVHNVVTKYVMQTSIMIEMPLRISSPPKGKVYFQQITKLPKNPL